MSLPSSLKSFWACRHLWHWFCSHSRQQRGALLLLQKTMRRCPVFCLRDAQRFWVSSEICLLIPFMHMAFSADCQSSSSTLKLQALMLDSDFNKIQFVCVCGFSHCNLKATTIKLQSKLFRDPKCNACAEKDRTSEAADAVSDQRYILNY